MNNQSAFTVKFNGQIARVIHTPVRVADSANRQTIKEFHAIWDTGASGSLITEKIVRELNLKPVGPARVKTTGGERQTNRFLVDIYLPNNVRVINLEATEGSIDDVSDVLIGMDIISLGDFAITNSNKQTVFSFKMPSTEEIDFVKIVDMRKAIAERKLKPQRNDLCPCGSGKKYK
ncbi:aspartyl protease family protein, partial [bacterium]|nr:aspartyl protease family protein [bacterium]